MFEYPCLLVRQVNQFDSGFYASNRADIARTLDFIAIVSAAVEAGCY